MSVGQMVFDEATRRRRGSTVGGEFSTNGSDGRRWNRVFGSSLPFGGSELASERNSEEKLSKVSFLSLPVQAAAGYEPSNLGWWVNSFTIVLQPLANIFNT